MLFVQTGRSMGGGSAGQVIWLQAADVGIARGEQNVAHSSGNETSFPRVT